MTFQHITLLDDILREEYLAARNFIYALIAEPIKQATGICIPDPRMFPNNRGLIEGFEPEKFKGLCNNDWIASHNNIPAEAARYLTSHILTESHVIGYEMPPWLVKILNESSISWIDIRLSPIRFSRDLYLVLRSSSGTLSDKLKDVCVTKDEIRLEAGLIRASVLHNQPRYENTLANGILFLGQTSNDASIISTSGNLLSVADFHNELMDITRGRRVLHKPHPYDQKWAKKEKKSLEGILGTKVRYAKHNIYELLSRVPDMEVVTLSSGAAQEAAFFDVRSHTLHKPICNLDAPEAAHVRFMDFASPSIWSTIFDTTDSIRASRTLPVIQENLMRRLHNAYWGYSEYLINNNSFWNQAFMHSYRNKQKSRQFLRIASRLLP